LSKKKILIIDDDKKLVEQWKLLLASEGYIVESFTKSVDAYKNLNEFDYDLILLDIMMPLGELQDINEIGDIPLSRECGIWLCEKIRGKHPDIPILAITDVQDSKMLLKIRENGATRILSKSLGMNKLLIYIKEII
jgi:DNA-binding response OmpR family regulator